MSPHSIDVASSEARQHAHSFCSMNEPTQQEFSMIWIRWVALGLFAMSISLAPKPAEAQLAPTGGHYAGRPSDTGHASLVNSSGGYQTSVPLELPAARGGSPVPAHIVYGGRGVGAAGLGWDVPLSYIRRDTTLAHRRPVGTAEVPPQPREQLTAVFEGRRLELIPHATGWVVRRDAPDISNDVVPLARTVLGTAPHSPGVGYVTNRAFMDVTGDGRLDRVTDGALARNTPGAALSGPNATFGMAPFETRTTQQQRYFGDHVDNVENDMLWRQAIDVNGDGRVDIVDAAEEAGVWVVYLNTPAPANPRDIVWQRRGYSTLTLAQHFRDRGLWSGDDFLPLQLRSTIRDRVYSACAIWNGSRWVEFEDESASGPCRIGGRLLSVGLESTLTMWQLADINGDGYPDVIFNSSSLMFESRLTDLPIPQFPVTEPVHTTRTVTLRLSAGAANKIIAAFNTIGVHLSGDADAAFSVPQIIRSNAGCGIGRWVSVSDSRQELTCSITDANGDGIADYVDGTSVFLGTGSHDEGAFFIAARC